MLYYCYGTLILLWEPQNHAHLYFKNFEGENRRIMATKAKWP